MDEERFRKLCAQNKTKQLDCKPTSSILNSNIPMNTNFEYEMSMNKTDSVKAIRSAVEGCLKHLQTNAKKRPDEVTVRAGLDIYNVLKVDDDVYQRYDVSSRYSKFIVVFDLEVEIVCDWEIHQEAMIVQGHFTKPNNG